MTQTDEIMNDYVKNLFFCMPLEVSVRVDLSTGDTRYSPSLRNNESALCGPLGGLERLFSSGAEVVQAGFVGYRKIEDVARKQMYQETRTIRYKIARLK